MPPIPKSVLKAYFETGDKPTQGQFFSLIESSLNLIDDRKYLGLKIYNTTLVYETGDITVYDGVIYQAIAITTGTFDPNAWTQVDFDNAIIPITYSALASLKSLSSLSAGQMYYITDRGIWIYAILKYELGISGYYLAINADYQNITGFCLGIWNPGLTGIIPMESYAIWNGLNYINTTGNVGTQPDSDPANWKTLDPATDRSYTMEIDVIKYDFDADFIFERSDKRGNFMSMTNDWAGMEFFQWGRDGVNGNYIKNSIFSNLNCYTPIFSVEITDYSSARISDDANCSNAIISGASLSIGSTTDLQRTIIRNTSIKISATSSTTNPGKRIEPGFSNFEEKVDITGSTIIDLIAMNYGGIFILASTNSTETLNNYNAAPPHPFELRPVPGLIVTINNGTGHFGEFSLPVPSLVLDGDKGDFAIFRVIGPLARYVHSVNYI